MGDDMGSRANYRTVAIIGSALLMSACTGSAGQEPSPPATVTVTATPSGAPSEAASPSPTPTPTIDTQQTLTRYFEAFVSKDPVKMREMRRYALKGSPADLYAIHQITSVNALSAFDPDDVTIGEGQVTVTSIGALSGEKTTTVYEDFEFDEFGKLTTWTVQDSGPLDERIQKLSGSITSNDVKFELLTAYETNAGFLAVTAKLTNKGNGPVDVSVTDYINPKGRQIRVNGFFTPRPGAYLDAYMDLGNSTVGGTLIVQFDFSTTREIVVE